MSERTAPESPDGPDEAFVRALLGEVGREPEPLPDTVTARLDDTLAQLAAERRESEPTVVPLDRARQRRRRGLQVLVAAAAVVVGGYGVTTAGLLQGSDEMATSADDSGAGAAEDSGGAETADGAFPLASGSLRADARTLVASDPAPFARLHRVAGSAGTGRVTGPDELDGDLPAPQPVDGRSLDTADGPLAGSEGSPGLEGGAAALPTPAAEVPTTVGRCADPLVPRRLTRLAVTYDGVDATAVLRPLAPAADGTRRVRVEVWDCTAPVRLATVVVRR
jgi:hypothetical protein